MYVSIYVQVVLLALAPHVLGVPVADPVADADPSAYASDYSHYLPVGAGYEALPSAQFHAQVDRQLDRQKDRKVQRKIE